MGGVAQLPERWKRAVATVNGAMGQAIGRVYVARYFSPEAKAKIDALVGRLRVALKARIERLDWMGPQTKLKALDKLARLNVKIAYPDKWRDYAALEVRSDDLTGDVQAGRKFAWLRQKVYGTSPRQRTLLSRHWLICLKEREPPTWRTVKPGADFSKPSWKPLGASGHLRPRLYRH